MDFESVQQENKADVSMLTDEERIKVLQRSQLLYVGLYRNQIHLPGQESSLCTHAFLNEIYEGKTFSWKMSDLRVLNCASTPNIGEL